MIAASRTSAGSIGGACTVTSFLTVVWIGGGCGGVTIAFPGVAWAKRMVARTIASIDSAYHTANEQSTDRVCVWWSLPVLSGERGSPAGPTASPHPGSAVSTRPGSTGGRPAADSQPTRTGWRCRDGYDTQAGRCARLHATRVDGSPIGGGAGLLLEVRL